MGRVTGRKGIMKAIQAALALGVSLCATPLRARAQAADVPPTWAYAVNPPDFKVKPDDGTPRHVPDSTAAFTVTQARDMFFAPDWHPSDHPPLPDIVAHGRKPDVMACGVCHRADGPGQSDPKWPFADQVRNKLAQNPLLRSDAPFGAH